MVMRDLASHQARHEDDVAWICLRKWSSINIVRDAPAPKVLHCSNEDRFSGGKYDFASALIDNEEGDCPIAELARESKTDRAGPND